MSKPSLFFLEKFPHENLIRPFFYGEKDFYLARSPDGLKKFKEMGVSSQSAVGLWIEDSSVLHKTQPLAQELDVEYYFPYSGMKPSNIASLGAFQGPKSMELPDFRIRDFSVLTPDFQILQQAQINSPKFSIIIPLFDNSDRAKKALPTWDVQQNKSYEIILVDDGSADNWIRQLQGHQLEHLTLMQLARPHKRNRGDHTFRAGVARNFGFQKSRGEKLIFCDSDILVPPNFLDHLCTAFASSDVIMPMRWQLSKESSESDRPYGDFSFEKDVRLSPGGYWEQFQMKDGLWNDLPDYWKWTSTFCLSLSRDHFQSVGGFKRTFLTYGFEDTELGYKLHRKGLRFSMLPINTYHLYQPDTHSEYQNDLQKKERLLKISADRFFRHHPSPEVYQAVKRWLE